MNKDFRQEFYKFRDKLKNNEPFALSRCNDGEMIILENEFIDISCLTKGSYILQINKEKHCFNSKFIKC